MTQERSGGFVKQAGIEIPINAVVSSKSAVLPKTVAERLRGAQSSEPNQYISLESALYADQMSPEALRKAKRHMGIRYMGQPR